MISESENKQLWFDDDICLQKQTLWIGHVVFGIRLPAPVDQTLMMEFRLHVHGPHSPVSR